MERSLFIIDENIDGLRIDKAISTYCPNISRSSAQKLINCNSVHLNGKLINKNCLSVSEGDIVEIEIPDLKPIKALPENIPLDIVYEDESVLVVNKPKGMVVHPAPGNLEGTLVNALLWHCGDSLSGINGVIRPGIVHRIDKDTSGLLIVAKTDQAHVSLSEQISSHSFTRKYEAIAHGIIKEDITIEAPIGRNPNDRKKMAVTPINSKNAITHVHIIQHFKNYTHIECQLETGRTHQIRVHLSYLHHPILSDIVYGMQKPTINVNGQCLHARTIGFIHPSTKKYMEFTSELPDYFKNVLSLLSKEN